MDPENSKFKNDKIIREHNVDTENDHWCEDLEDGKVNQCKKANKLIKNSIA